MPGASRQFFLIRRLDGELEIQHLTECELEAWLKEYGGVLAPNSPYSTFEAAQLELDFYLNVGPPYFP